VNSFRRYSDSSKTADPKEFLIVLKVYALPPAIYQFIIEVYLPLMTSVAFAPGALIPAITLDLHSS
jgi:hypothetical protein